MKDFDPKFIVSKGFFDWLTLSGSEMLKTAVLSNPIFQILYNKDVLEGAHMKYFDPKYIVSKGFFDWFTLSGSELLKTAVRSLIKFFRFYITKMGWKELIWKILTKKFLCQKDF